MGHIAKLRNSSRVSYSGRHCNFIFSYSLEPLRQFQPKPGTEPPLVIDFEVLSAYVPIIFLEEQHLYHDYGVGEGTLHSEWEGIFNFNLTLPPKNLEEMSILYFFNIEAS